MSNRSLRRNDDDRGGVAVVDEVDFSPQAALTFADVERHGRPARPLEFPAPSVRRARRGNALVVHLETGQRQVLRGIVHREVVVAATDGGDDDHQQQHHHDGGPEYAYFPQRRLQEAIYGSVWACLVLRRHRGPAADEEAAAAGEEPGSPRAPLVWEITRRHVAIKMMVWERIHRQRGRLLEDPVKEIAAMQLIGGDHPHVLGSREVLQDNDFLYGVMEYCSGGDLFGVVVQYTERTNGERGMPEHVARYWFRQILSGLNYLQINGVCHRDLSLENILVNSDNCLIIDMGMCLRVPYTDPTNARAVTDVSASSLRRLIKPQGTCGKHNYMSPEIFANRRAFDGFAVDLWAAGVILYIMITGFPPYDQASLADPRFEAIVRGHLVEQLREWDIILSEGAGDLMQRMLRHDPRDRLTLDEVRRHPWVTSNEEFDPNARATVSR